MICSCWLYQVVSEPLEDCTMNIPCRLHPNLDTILDWASSRVATDHVMYRSTWYGLSCLAWLARMSRSSLHRKGCFGLRRVFMWLKNVPTKTCPRTSTSRSLSLKQCCGVKVIFVQPDMVATCSEIAANMTEAGVVGCKFGSVHMWKKPLRPTKYLSPEPTQSD